MIDAFVTELRAAEPWMLYVLGSAAIWCGVGLIMARRFRNG